MESSKMLPSHSTEPIPNSGMEEPGGHITAPLCGIQGHADPPEFLRPPAPCAPFVGFTLEISPQHQVVATGSE